MLFAQIFSCSFFFHSSSFVFLAYEKFDFISVASSNLLTILFGPYYHFISTFISPSPPTTTAITKISGSNSSHIIVQRWLPIPEVLGSIPAAHHPDSFFPIPQDKSRDSTYKLVSFRLLSNILTLS